MKIQICKKNSFTLQNRSQGFSQLSVSGRAKLPFTPKVGGQERGIQSKYEQFWPKISKSGGGAVDPPASLVRNALEVICTKFNFYLKFYSKVSNQQVIDVMMKLQLIRPNPGGICWFASLVDSMAIYLGFHETRIKT